MKMGANKGTGQIGRSAGWAVRLAFAAAISICLSFTVWAETQDNPVQQRGLMDYIVKRYDESNGMDTSEANAVLQDEKGYIWVGSYSGLSRYCGSEFENVSAIREDAPKAGIRVLFEDSSKRIWIGTNDDGIYLYENERFAKIANKKSDVEENVLKLSVRSIAEDQNGRILAGTTNGLFLIDGGQISKYREERLESETIEGLACDAEGNIWGTTSSRLIFVLEKDGRHRFWNSSSSKDKPSGSLLHARDGSIYIGTEGGSVFQVAPSKDHQDDLRVKRLSIGTLETVNKLYQDKQGWLWACTDRGVGYFEENHVFNEIVDGSFGTIITDMWQDYEGNLWFASSKSGLLELVKGKFINVGYEAEIAGETVNASLLYDSSLYIGTDNGLTIMNSQGQMTENELTDFLRGIRIRSLMKDSHGNLWISAYKKYGLIKYDGKTGKWKCITEEDGLKHDQVRAALELSGGDIAVATNGGVSLIRNDEVIKNYGTADGIINETILCLEETSDGKLLAGSDGNGIYKIDLQTDEVDNIGVEDGLSSGIILRMVRDEQAGGIWVSNGPVLSLWKEEDTPQIKEIENSLGSIFDIKPIGEDIWLFNASGLIRVSRQALLNGIKEYTILDRKDGLTSCITANSWNYLSADKELYLCTDNGVYYIDTKDIHKNVTEPKIAVRNITVDDRVYYKEDNMELPTDSRRIVIDLDLLSFGLAEGTLHYYLEGFDKDVHTLESTENKITYTNLPGGTYTFHGIGYNADGEKSDEITFQIHKTPSFFEQQYIHILSGAAAILLLLSIIVIIQHIHKRRLIRRQKEYKAMTDQTIRIVTKAIDAKDSYTIGHSHRVAVYSVEIGRRYGLSKDKLEQLYYSGLLHDIGKIGVPDSVLKKPGKLTDEEYDEIKRHPAIGGEILKEFTLGPWIADGAQYHHERYDGKGYNTGLSGEDIPIFARIISVADAYDSMNSNRVYRTSRDKDFIYQEIQKGKGSQFDPVFAQIMMDMIKDGFEAEE